MSGRLRRMLGLAVGAVLLAYLGILAVAFVRQRDLMYFPAASRTEDSDPQRYGLQGFSQVRLTTSDGQHPVAWWRPPDAGRGAVIYFHGNAGSLAGGVERMRDLAGAGLGVLAVEYRGYGPSPGRPSQDGLTADGLAAFDFTRREAPHARIAPFGESLGTGVAMAVAQRRPVAGLVLDSPFSSTLRLARRTYPWLLPDLLMKDRWNSERAIRSVAAPVLAGHCAADTVVPLAEAQRLIAASQGRGTLMELQGCGHVQAWEAGLRAPALRRLIEWTQPPA